MEAVANARLESPIESPVRVGCLDRRNSALLIPVNVGDRYPDLSWDWHPVVAN
jgi:hypothetical protein